MTGEPLLEIRNLSVAYGSGDKPVRAVQDVDLTLRRGETLGLAGESGCGKSTLAAAVTRLLRAPGRVTSGEVVYHRGSRTPTGADGSALARPDQPIDILSLSKGELRAFRWSEIAIVFQSAMNALNPVLDIESQLTDILRAHRPEMSKDARRARAIELLEVVGVPADRLRSYPHELSGGMRQRVMIAMALTLDPDLLVLDEPTTALDVIVQREILRELQRLREQFGFSVLFITHDLSLLLELADTIAVMYAGRVVEYGPAEQIYRDAKHPYTQGLLNSFPPLRGPRKELAGIPGSPPDLRTLPPGCNFAARCARAFEPCYEVPPKLISVEPDRVAACHLHDREFAR